MTRLQLKKRPRYTINPKLFDKTDELYREVIRPRMTLLDSEEAAIGLLKRSAGINTGLLQLPMQDKFADNAYAMINA